MQKQSEVQTKKRNLRANLMTGLSIKTKNLRFQSESPTRDESPVKRRLRSGSFNLKKFDNIDLRREVSIKQSFQDCYELGEKIGQGGHSVVYMCKDIQTLKTFAVKVTRKNDPQNLHNLKEQYRILKSLEHECILKGYFLFLNEKKSTCYLVCEYSDAPDLRCHIIERKKLNKVMPEQQAAQILSKVLGALQYLHEKKVSHRDIKPDNILYDPKNETVKIIDFEVAKMPRYTHQKLEMWTKAGTPSYRSPQMVQGSYNENTDMWSLGLVAYELLTGKFPFKINYQKDMFSDILHQEPKYEDLKISKLAIDFLQKLLQKDPMKRISAKKASSHPFIVSRCCLTPPCFNKQKKLNSSFEMDEAKEDFSSCSRFYDENMTFGFNIHTDKDIGIRFCEQ